MIAQLTGTIAHIEDGSLVIDVRGVGYLVSASRATLSKLTRGIEAMLLIETHVREDKIALYGFASAGEREWFRTLTTVQGVGPKVGLAILSTLAPDVLMTALAAGDAKALTRADGVGPKLAARIAAELKGKAAGIGTVVPFAPAGESGGPMADAVSALVNLGYSRSEAFSAVARAKGSLGDKAEVGALIKASLKELAA